MIDSVAAVYRIETNAINRAMDMRKVAQALQSLSSEYGCVIICVNQVNKNLIFHHENDILFIFSILGHICGRRQWTKQSGAMFRFSLV